MDCWEKTQRARDLILGSSHSATVPRPIVGFARQIKIWGEIQGVSRSDYPRVARVLWGDPARSMIRGLRQYTLITAPLDEIVHLEEAVVDGMTDAGTKNRHYSWASKMLHFLLPATMPVYDTYVRDRLKTTEGIEAYTVIAANAKACAKELAPFEAQLIGTKEPKTLLRAIDKFYWWQTSLE